MRNGRVTGWASEPPGVEDTDVETMVVPARPVRPGPKARAAGFVWHRFHVLLDPRDLALLRLLQRTMEDDKGDIPDRAAVLRHGLAVLAERALSPEQMATLPARAEMGPGPEAEEADDGAEV